MISISRKILLFSLVVSFVGIFIISRAQSDNPSSATNYEGVVMEVMDEVRNENGGYYQKLKVHVLTGEYEEETFLIENGMGDSPSTQSYGVGDKIVLSGYVSEDGNAIFFIDDFVRRSTLLYLFLIFIILAVVVGGKRGVASFIGMVITFFMIFMLVLPKISTGSSPIIVVSIFSLLSIPITFYLSHGFNKKTHVAIAGTLISLTITIALSVIFVNSAKLTGFTSDEASFLQLLKGQAFSMRGLLLAGIIIGMLGVLDDITVSQSAIVFQLKQANQGLTFFELYKRSMDVGKDHIASMINTLILVYTGASLPLLLLFTDSSHTFGQVVNYEIIASEIIRTLLGSIGLILAVPVTTFIAASIADSDKGGTKR